MYSICFQTCTPELRGKHELTVSGPSTTVMWMSAPGVLIYVDIIHNIYLPRLKPTVMHFVALSPTRTTARTTTRMEAPKTNAATCHPKSTLVEQSSLSFPEHVTKRSCKTQSVTDYHSHHTEHRRHRTTFKGV